MNIDWKTASNLELVNNLSNGGSKDTLYSAINHTTTTVGSRLLRSNILRPLTDIKTIDCRLNLVDLLVQQPKFLEGVKAILRKFPEQGNPLIYQISFYI